MNPIIEKNIEKWLIEIKESECIKVSKDTLDQIIAFSNKDMWNAITSLHFYKTGKKF